MSKLDGLSGRNPSPRRKQQTGYESPLNVLEALRTVNGVEDLLDATQPTKKSAQLIRDNENQKPRKTALAAIDDYIKRLN